MIGIDLTGKTAFVTGSTAGIGRATAQALLDAGAKVFINGRHASKTEAVALEMGASPVVADLATAEGCQQAVESVGEVDILVNNAGMFRPSDFFETEDSVWQDHWNLNVMSGVRLSRALAPAMVKKGWGRILFLGSESGYNIPVEMIHYGVSKTADASLSRGLAKRLAGTGVTVNTILPGPTLSEGVEEMLREEMEKSGKSKEEVARDFVMQVRPSSIIQRAASVEEVANMVLYVASPLSSATTGAALRVDGGVVDFIM
ncbi:NAD(P)-dependent dehydrogenase (short-subunit alcohol dehydrogenase family) [Haloferula luteola]|uniref:NAD(P)-dependent dehydrogenase (Short-subunit alcohol dehydrogenase family) n=1 Tax=Haloferula luteola TaxID=595692 RepID=A0A840V3P4_9BACT|nr:SDR family NAD(P)-dependent oxidoreductase [Haloferula luteola]MBB5350274.1 NAD(P)-dependent dehydrogenase (short-subunit alcohol dehydrogenase family) [Haloferula luteola]